jgi:negative regulator of sigma-B (phosphoserine phosphatase)
VKMQVGHASVPKIGERDNGDRPFHRYDPEGRNLIAVIDGLGHGPEAQLASLAALRYLDQVALDKPFEEVMFELDKALHGTRGAAGTVCISSGFDLVACSVGNVELRSVRADIPLIPSAGILGRRVRKFNICRATLKSACRLVIFSDGLTNPTSIPEYKAVSPQLACEGILERHRRTYDDATVLIADLE